MSFSKVSLEFALVDRASDGAKRIAQNLRGIGSMGSQAAAAWDSAAAQVRGSLQQIGRAKALYGQILQPGLDAAGQLQKALNGLTIQLKPGAAKDLERQLAAAGADAGRIAGPTRFSASEVVNTQTALIQAGLKQGAVVGRGGAAEAAASLATAVPGLSLEQATEAMITAGNVFRVAGDKYGDVADQLARASIGTDPAELAAAIAAAPNAGTVGLGSQEVLGIFAALAANGRKGPEAGTALKTFLDMAGRNDAKMGLGLFDAHGEMKDVAGMAESLRKKFGVMTEQERMAALPAAFGDGAGVAQALLDRSEGGSYEATLAKIGAQRGLSSRMDVLNSGYVGQVDALQGTVQTTLSTLFTPALDPLAATAASLNEAAGRLNDAAAANPAISQAVSYGSIGAVAAVALSALGGAKAAGLFTALSSGGMSGLLKSGAGSVASGVVQAKALQAAAGVQPVFVVNMPAAGLGGVLGGAGAAAGALTGAEAMAGAGAAGAGLGGIGVMGAGLVAAAGMAGYGVGSLIQEHAIQGTQAQSVIEDVMGLYQGALAGSALSAGSRLAGAETRADARGAWNRGAEDLAKMLGLSITIKLDKDGYPTASAVTDEGRAVRAATRTGPS